MTLSAQRTSAPRVSAVVTKVWPDFKIFKNSVVKIKHFLKTFKHHYRF